MMISERNILIWLNDIGISNGRIEKLKDYFYDLRELWTIDRNTLMNSKILRDEHLDKIFQFRDNKFLEKILIRIDENHINVVTILDDDYPDRLVNITDRPCVLYYKGSILPEDNIAIGIVGSRKSTAYGKWACERFTKELAQLGVTIISGLAQGIDTYAHKTAIESGARTLGILGNGLNIVYPKNNSQLYREVSEAGAVISEYPLDTEPLSYNFPQRNRIISGLSLGIVVIEAKEKSGSLITAHHALEQGKDVFAVPGNINSIYSGGTNRLIKDGARPLLELEDILEEIYELKTKTKMEKKDELDYSQLSSDELRIMQVIIEGPVHTDIIAIQTGLDISTVVSILTILELKGLIKELTSRTFACC